MGWAARASKNPSGLFAATTDERKLPHYGVKVWTAFTWTDPGRGAKAEKVRDMLRAQEIKLELFGETLQVKIRNTCPHFLPVVTPVRVDKQPQLMFEMTVPAASEEDAIIKAKYWIKRAASNTKSFKQGGRKQQRPVGLTFPYGKVTAELI